MRHLSSLTRDELVPPAVEVRSLNYWTAREVPGNALWEERAQRLVVFGSTKDRAEILALQLLISWPGCVTLERSTHFSGLCLHFLMYKTVEGCKT